MVDNFASQEDLVDDVAAGDGACAPVTDGATYANRQVNLDADVEVTQYYGRCSACLGDGLGVDNILTEEDGWRLTWSDEFNAAANTPVDPTKWTHDVGGGGLGERSARAQHRARRERRPHGETDTSRSPRVVRTTKAINTPLLV